MRTRTKGCEDSHLSSSPFLNEEHCEHNNGLDIERTGRRIGCQGLGNVVGTIASLIQSENVEELGSLRTIITTVELL